MKTKEEIIAEVFGWTKFSAGPVISETSDFIECMDKFADQEKAALKEKIIKSCNEAIDMEMESVGTEFPVVEAYKNVIEFIESL